MPRNEALVSKALDWMRRHRPDVSWSRQDADHLIRLFDAELDIQANDGRGTENRKETLREYLEILQPIPPLKYAAPWERPAVSCVPQSAPNMRGKATRHDCPRCGRRILRSADMAVHLVTCDPQADRASSVDLPENWWREQE